MGDKKYLLQVINEDSGVYEAIDYKDCRLLKFKVSIDFNSGYYIVGMRDGRRYKTSHACLEGTVGGSVVFSDVRYGSPSYPEECVGCDSPLFAVSRFGYSSLAVENKTISGSNRYIMCAVGMANSESVEWHGYYRDYGKYVLRVCVVGKKSHGMNGRSRECYDFVFEDGANLVKMFEAPNGGMVCALPYVDMRSVLMLNGRRV